MKKKLLFLLIAPLFIMVACNLVPKQENIIKSPEQRDLSFMVPIESQSQKQWYEQQASAFMSENTDIALRLRFADRENYWDSITQFYSQQALPDMILMSHVMIPAYQQLGILQSINSFIQSEKVKEIVPSKILNTGSYNDVYYGIPYTCNTYALFCNVDLFTKYGCSIPETWADLYYNSVELLREPADSFAIAASSGEELTNQFLQLLYANNATIRTLKETQAIEAYQMLANYVEERLIARDCVNWNRIDLTKKFASREVAMMIGDSSLMPLLKQMHPNFTWMIVPIPGEKDGHTLFACDNVVVTSDAYQSDAFRFLSFLLSKQQVTQRINQLGSLSIRNDVESSFSKASGSEKVFYEQFYRAYPIPSLLLWQNISYALQESVMDIFSKEQPPVQISQNTYDLVNTYIIDGK